MRAKHTETMLRLTGEIKNIAKDLPPGKRHQIINRCNKINMAIKKTGNMESQFQQTHKQIVDRYNAKQAIYEAMTKGRHISLEDSLEFAVSQMHTTICTIRQDLKKKSLPYVMKDRWIDSGKYRKKIKEYWLEAKC